MAGFWWCPTGHLAMLPIHAAGHYGPDGAGAVRHRPGSFPPTPRRLTALARARHAAATTRTGRSRRLRAISVPEIAGASKLRYTDLERPRSARAIPPTSLPWVGNEGTIDSVTADFTNTTGCTSPATARRPSPASRPPSSIFDDVLTVNRLASETTVNSELAYLSGCHTAARSFTDPDEAEHLARGLPGHRLSGT